MSKFELIVAYLLKNLIQPEVYQQATSKYQILQEL